MWKRLRHWRERRIMHRYPIAERDWRHALAHCNPAQRLDAMDQARLRVLVTMFLRRKAIEPVQGLELATADRVLLATHACVPILELGLDWYTGWHSIIVYPDAFIPRREEADEAGVVHHTSDVLVGEAWSRGPVIVSWADVSGIGQTPGHNVVIHEMAHKLDMLNGSADGFPPLHRNMDRRAWSRVFTSAWHDLQRLRDDGMALPVDAYALESPAEFFAVASEQFFETPAALQSGLPDVYAQMAAFYQRQVGPHPRRSLAHGRER